MVTKSHQIAFDTGSEDRMELDNNGSNDAIVPDISNNFCNLLSDPSDLFTGRSPKKKEKDEEDEAYYVNLSDLQYDTHPPDRPHWLTGLEKPLPHPSLTFLEDYKVLTRFWFEEIKRFEYLRSRRSPPEGQPANGECDYNHYGETKEVRRPPPSGRRRPKAVYARGC
ncbi:hypothetical protein PTMSG1_07620 [Pyrenophora teres f. maculata]|nr:hypothetical protein PTMSG1_07620 [Pyrenophora teres f. maculata]